MKSIFKSVVDIDGKITIATLLHPIHLEHLEDHAKDLSLISEKSLYFQCLGKLTHAFLNGLSCLILIEDTFKEVHIIESICVRRSGNGLVITSEAGQSLWTFGTKSDLDSWETQLLLVEQLLQKPKIPSKVEKKLYNSPPITPTRDINDRFSIQSTFIKNNRSWISFKKTKKLSKERAIIRESKTEVKEHHELAAKEEKKIKKVVQKKPISTATEEEGRVLYVFDTDEELELLVTTDNFDDLRLSTDDRLSLDFEDHPDIFSDLKTLIKNE